VTPIHEEG